MKVISAVKYTFTAIGIAMFIGAFIAYLNTQRFVDEAVSSQGTVVDLVYSNNSGVYQPVVEFTTQGGAFVEFISSTGSNPASYYRGEVVDVLYPVNFPEMAKIDSFFMVWVWPIVLSGMGAVFFLIGFLMIVFGKLKNKKIDYLKKNGVAIQTKFQSVEFNTRLEVNGRNPYLIVTQWTDPATNELYVFNSENIWFDPSDHIQEEISVLIEKDNPKKYYVDISFLPKVAN